MNPSLRFSPARWRLALALSLVAASAGVARAAEAALAKFQREIMPVLEKNCYDCHGAGVAKGGVTLDEFTTDGELKDPKLWLRALKNIRSGIMPPANEGHLTPEHLDKLSTWIKRDIFELDPAVPDPGRVTVRRLNRTEYRNTIRDLMGVDFDTRREFPSDDSGYGFDNIGDVLTVSPMLLEKYLDAAQTIVTQALPAGPTTVAEQTVNGSRFTEVARPAPAPNRAELAAVIDGLKPAAEVKARADGRAGPPPPTTRPPPSVQGSAIELSYYTPATVATKHTVAHAGQYQVVFDVRAVEKFVDNVFDTNKCRLTLRVDGEAVLEREFTRQGNKNYTFTYDRTWTAGEHELSFEVEPIGGDQPQARQLRMRLNNVVVRGPMAKEYWVTPKDYAKFFPRATPADLAGQRAYAAEILTKFATRAFRRPIDDESVLKLVRLAESVFTEKDNTFEAGIAQAMVAVLASPRFIFREEGVEPLKAGQKHPLVDEYALAARLSYFFWSTMPDEELFRLAKEHRLRANLSAQVTRLLADGRANELVKNFTGQWLQGRDIPNVPIDENAIFMRDHPETDAQRKAREESRAQFQRIRNIAEDKRTPEEVALFAEIRKARAAGNNGRPMAPPFPSSLRSAMQEETEQSFAYVLKQDRPLTELIEADYVFVNGELAKHYGIEGVSGRETRRVTLPPDSPRGGVLTSGTVLAVTSNPTRTSPVKRGVFILEAILGTPPAPPPPNIPSLEDAASPEKLKKMTLRENLALHATNPLCASCHYRMDPLGLALENFNAMGQWRTEDMGQAVEPAGQLITGEKFKDIRELKHILATNHRDDFYHCVSEKLLTYALGRGLDYHDTATLDLLVAQLEAAGGKPSALIRGIVESAPFQQRRRSPGIATAAVSPSAPTDSSLATTSR